MKIIALDKKSNIGDIKELIDGTTVTILYDNCDGPKNLLCEKNNKDLIFLSPADLKTIECDSYDLRDINLYFSEGEIITIVEDDVVSFRLNIYTLRFISESKGVVLFSEMHIRSYIRGSDLSNKSRILRDSFISKERTWFFGQYGAGYSNIISISTSTDKDIDLFNIKKREHEEIRCNKDKRP